MTKNELIKRLNEIDVSGDTEVVFPNVEFGGFETVNKINVAHLHQITEDGKIQRPVTGCDYVDDRDYSYDPENYQEKKSRVIIVEKH